MGKSGEVLNNSAMEKKMEELLRDPNRMQKAEESRRQEIAELEARSKELDELVVVENFTVEDVVSECCGTAFTPHSEIIIGGKSPSYEGGFTSNLTLKVTPDNAIPVRTLNFKGSSVVRAGDYISAEILRCDERKIMEGFGRPYHQEDKTFYFDRKFMPEETAIELAILSDDGKVLRRDRAVGYIRRS